MALNPVRRKVRNKYIDLVIKGQAKKTPQGWQVGKKTFAQGRGTTPVSSGYYLDKHTGFIYAKRERNAAKRRKKNIEQGFYDEHGFHPIRASSDYSEGQRPSRSKRAKATKSKAKATASHKRKVSSRKKTTGRLAARAIKKTVKTRKRRNVQQGFYDSSGFHPIRASADYSPAVAGETGRRAKTTRSKTKRAAKSKAASTARRKSGVRARKATTSRLAGRSLKRSAGLLKKKSARRKNSPQVLALVNRTSPKAGANRREFAGVYRGDKALRYPEGTPQGLSKLGRLIKIKTEFATITPVNSHTWLVRDLKGKLHVGTTDKDGVIWEGPAESFGKVKQIEYEDVKRHLGYNRLTQFYHHVGEENGIQPTLHADGKGGLKFRGGDYRITPEGVVN